jgi:S-formylglutathione hydrolase FrmB
VVGLRSALRSKTIRSPYLSIAAAANPVTTPTMTAITNNYTIRSQQRVAGGGSYYRISHVSTSTQTTMTFGLFVPSRNASSISNADGAAKSSNNKKDNVPALYFLSGLTCDGACVWLVCMFVVLH